MPDCDVTAVVACRDDEERVGHVVRRLSSHFRSLGLKFEILAVDEHSGDNTLALLALIKRGVPELEVVAGAADGRALVRGAQLARGRVVLLCDARTEPPLPALSHGLARIDGGHDIVGLAGRALLLRRARTWRLFESLVHDRDLAGLERRITRRATSLGLRTHVAAPARRSATPALARLRQVLLAPLALLL